MKLSIFLIGLFASMALMIGKRSCSSVKEGNVNALQEIMQSALNNPEYLSLDLIKKQQILIAFFRILEKLDKYGNVMFHRF